MLRAETIDITAHSRRAPKVALVHDFLSQPGGAERVVLQLCALFPDAPLYTSFYDADRTFPEFRQIDVRTSHLQDAFNPSSFRRRVLRYPDAFRQLDLSDFDLVLASSSAFAHHVQHPNLHVYCHTPPRFLYDLRSYLGRRFGLAPLAPFVAPAMQPLRRADRMAVAGARSYVANSKHTAKHLAAAYDMDASVIHPPVWTAHLSPRAPLPKDRRVLVISRLLPYKRVDRAVRACALAGVPLTVAGDGPERRRLEAMAAPGTLFTGPVTDVELAELVRQHSLLVVPGVEDFGLVPLEANYSGRPVVAPAAGGALETVRPGENGLLVTSEDDASWASAIVQALEMEWDVRSIWSASERFSAERFGRAVQGWLGIATPETREREAETVGA